MFREESRGRYVVEYRAAEDLGPDKQTPLVDAIRRAEIPTGILFVVGPKVRTVDLAVPAFWLRVVGDRTVPIKAMAIVSSSTAVRVAASGFSVANKLRGVPVEVGYFAAADDARRWLDKVMVAK